VATLHSAHKAYSCGVVGDSRTDAGETTGFCLFFFSFLFFCDTEPHRKREWLGTNWVLPSPGSCVDSYVRDCDTVPFAGSRDDGGAARTGREPRVDHTMAHQSREGQIRQHRGAVPTPQPQPPTQPPPPAISPGPSLPPSACVPTRSTPLSSRLTPRGRPGRSGPLPGGGFGGGVGVLGVGVGLGVGVAVGVGVGVGVRARRAP